MGHKINPIGFRLGINRTWDSRWYADDNYAVQLHEDLKIRKFLTKRLAQASISKVVIERPHKKCRVSVYTASGCCDWQEGRRHRHLAQRNRKDDEIGR